ncbi:MAG: response regulator [Gammaproteobacteria bacterium]|nr:response regulator [Gammaproteobacteria bacterium]
MTEFDKATGGNRAPSERFAALMAAIRRINAGLDLDAVLGEAVASARALTGARKGIIVTLDEDGVPQDPVFSGLTPDEEQEQLDWPGNARLFEHLRGLASPVRSADFPAYVRDLGIDSRWTISRTFQGMPMRHRGLEVGSFSLAEKADGKAFTEQDEEVLSLFAAQAASAIAEARAHQSERRARANLKALVDISPVRVVVFDAKSGRAVSFNREMRRIAESLRTPDAPPEQILEVLTVRRADGSEISLSEFPLAQQPGSGERPQAEEMVLSVPDGRSVRTLIYAAPVPDEGGAVASVLATVQDLGPLAEVERLRTEFLELVNRELRGPLAAIKGSALTLLEAALPLDPAEMREYHRLIVEQADHMRCLIGDLLDIGHIEAGTLSVSPEPSAVANLIEFARSTFQGGGARHAVVIDLPSDLPPVMADRRRIVQVLNNLLANAAQHAPDSSTIRVWAAREDAHVAVSVADEGQALPPDRLAHLFRKPAAPPASASAGGTPLHGLGLAICKGLVEAHGGRIRAESAGPGHGTAVVITMPVTDDVNGEVSGISARRLPELREDDAPTRILVVEDDPLMQHLLRNALSDEGYEPVVTGDHTQIARILRKEQPALAVLDVVLPGADGIELMQQIPELTDLPVILIFGYGGDQTVERALDVGATDYIVKPFSPTELAARVRVALRRRERPAPFVLGELAIDYRSRRVTAAGSAVNVTATEFELLRTLSLEAGRVVTYKTLVRRVWGKQEENASRNRVRVFVKSLREKLGEDAESPTWIFNVRGVGYRMPDPG